MGYLKSFLSLIFALSICAANSQSLGESSGQWYKGNLHTHSYWSDGDEFPEVILDWYKERDYNFMALSDHNTIANEEKWITLKSDTIYQTAFKNYLKKYGDYSINSDESSF